MRRTTFQLFYEQDVYQQTLMPLRRAGEMWRKYRNARTVRDQA